MATHSSILAPSPGDSSILCKSDSVSFSVVSNSLQSMDCSPVRLLCPWDPPGKNTGVGHHSLLQGIFPTQGSNLGFPCCRQILYHLSHQGKPLNYVYIYVWKYGYIVCIYIVWIYSVDIVCVCMYLQCVYIYIYTWCVHMCVYIFMCVCTCIFLRLSVSASWDTGSRRSLLLRARWGRQHCTQNKTGE